MIAIINGMYGYFSGNVFIFSPRFVDSKTIICRYKTFVNSFLLKISTFSIDFQHSMWYDKYTKGGNDMTLNERIKKVRTDKGLTQEEFAKKLEIKRNTVATYEMGRSVPSGAVLSLISTKFAVNMEWLTDGVGEPYKKRTKTQEIGNFVNELMTETDDSFKKRFVHALSKLDERDWETIAKIIEELK